MGWFFCEHKTWDRISDTEVKCADCGKIKKSMCNHEWEKLSELTHVCKHCGKTIEIKCEHEWEDKNDTTLICKVCGDVRAIDCKHEWKEYHSTLLVCEKCGVHKEIECVHDYQRNEELDNVMCVKCSKVFVEICKHEWETVVDKKIPSEMEIMKQNGFNPSQVKQTMLVEKHEVVLKCTKCGLLHKEVL
jgi:hypothetical protein